MMYLKFLATQRAEPLVLSQLLSVGRHKLLHLLLRILAAHFCCLVLRQNFFQTKQRAQLLLHPLLPLLNYLTYFWNKYVTTLNFLVQVLKSKYQSCAMQTRVTHLPRVWCGLEGWVHGHESCHSDWAFHPHWGIHTCCNNQLSARCADTKPVDPKPKGKK